MTEVVLRRGDLLYIPRGFPHQAVAVKEEQSSVPAAAEEGDGQLSFALRPPQPSEANDEASPSESSVHVTFGIEIDEESCWAGLLHVAVACSASDGQAGDAALEFCCEVFI